MNSNNVMVAAERLVKSYEDGRIRVLDGVDLAVYEGEFISIVGASGSGKSTLLHLLGVLDRPDSGRVVLDGQDVGHVQKLSLLRARLIGFVFQLHYLMPTLSAIENVALPLMARRISRRARLARAAEMLARVSMDHRATHVPAQLSGGERQRVAIARALVNRPRLILADEPTGNLDQESTTLIMDLLLELNRTDHLTMIVVTHDQEVASMAQRTVRMRDGRIIEFGT